MGFCRDLGLCLSEIPPISPAPSQPPPPSSFIPLRPSIAVLVGVLTTTFSLTSLLLLYAKHCKHSSSTSSSSPAPFSSSSAVTAPRRNSGLSPALIDSLPAFRFSSLRCPSSKPFLLDCAVCLSAFLPADPLRLLPRCRHAFHLDCLDTWLSAHSTCPLCRSLVSPDDLLLLPPLPANPDSDKPPRRISGRHSYAGEKSAPPLLEFDPQSRRSTGCAPILHSRKDGLLLPAEEAERRFGHRIIVSSGRDPVQERWSDLRLSDLLFLRSEMIITDSGRFSCGRISAEGRRSLTSVSDIAGARRTTTRRTEEQDRTMRQWLVFAAGRTARWLGRPGGDSSNEPNG